MEMRIDRLGDYPTKPWIGGARHVSAANNRPDRVSACRIGDRTCGGAKRGGRRIDLSAPQSETDPRGPAFLWSEHQEPRSCHAEVIEFISPPEGHATLPRWFYGLRCPRPMAEHRDAFGQP